MKRPFALAFLETLSLSLPIVANPLKFYQFAGLAEFNFEPLSHLPESYLAVGTSSESLYRFKRFEDVYDFGFQPGHTFKHLASPSAIHWKIYVNSVTTLGDTIKGPIPSPQNGPVLRRAGQVSTICKSRAFVRHFSPRALEFYAPSQVRHGPCNIGLMKSRGEDILRDREKDLAKPGSARDVSVPAGGGEAGGVEVGVADRIGIPTAFVAFVKLDSAKRRNAGQKLKVE